MSYEDRDYMPPSDIVERRVSLARVIMFTMIGAYGFSLLWSRVLFVTSPEKSVFLFEYFCLHPVKFVFKLHLWQLATYWLFPCNVFGLVFDALTLWFFGKMVEDLIGLKKFAILWAGGVLSAGLVFVVLSFLLFPGLPFFGAGGAMLGMIVASALWWPNQQALFFFVPMRLKWLAIIIVAINLAYGIESFGPPYFAVLAGAAWGVAFWRFHDPVTRALARWDERAERRASVREAASEREDAVEVDRILAKIARDGMGSLSSAEKRTLERASQKKRSS